MAAPSLLFMAKPPPEVRQALRRTLAEQGWDRQLGDTAFDSENWHQSLSHPVPADSTLRDRLVHVGARTTAVAFTVVLNRVRGTGGPGHAIHWAFRAGSTPRPFSALVAALRAGLVDEGLESMPGHSPHVTVSYRAPHPLASTVIRPIAWRIDELLLVKSRSEPSYHYHTLGRWPLQPVPAGLESQRDLW